jgi:hypothetical protein
MPLPERKFLSKLRPRFSTASVIIVEPVCRTHENPWNFGSVNFIVFPMEVFGAGIYSSTTIYGSIVLINAVERVEEI